MAKTLSEIERTRVTNYLAETHDQVLRAGRSFSSAQLDFRTAPDRWSIAENLEHLGIIDDRVMNRIEEVMKAPPISEKSAWEGRDDELLAEIRSREKTFVVPEIGRPRNQLSHAELFPWFESLRDRLHAFAATTNQPLRSFLFPHPVYGMMDCYQWLLAMGAHCERHLQQIHEVTSSRDFP